MTGLFGLAALFRPAKVNNRWGNPEFPAKTGFHGNRWWPPLDDQVCNNAFQQGKSRRFDKESLLPAANEPSSLVQIITGDWMVSAPGEGRALERRKLSSGNGWAGASPVRFGAHGARRLSQPRSGTAGRPGGGVRPRGSGGGCAGVDRG